MSQSQGYLYSYKIEPFLLKNKTSNILSLNQTYIGPHSTSTNKSMRKSMLGMIGEGFERAAMVMFNTVKNTREEHNYNCIDMLTKEIINKRELKNLYRYLYDSCGMATHLNTENCVENALSEFIERQSFILSYLAKKIPKRIRKTAEFLAMIPAKYHHVEFYDISIIDNYKVYFAIGVKNDVVNCALGAGYTAESAMQKTINELHISVAKHGSIVQEEGKHKDYIHLFHMLSIEQIVNAYKYLEQGEWIVFEKSEKKDISYVLNELNCKYGMRPLMMCLFHPRYSQSNLRYAKNVKIFDVNWFPSFNIASIPGEIFDNIEKVIGMSLSRKTNFIPFP